MTATLRFTTSWDDGHPLDARVGDLLARFGFSGTFYVPSRNSEGRPVMEPAALRALSQRFEIGGHTRDHVRLHRLSPGEVAEQLRANREDLQQTLGTPVAGFCYPGGRRSPGVRQAVIDAGYTYARTIEGLRLDAGDDPFALPTTCQFYPHGGVRLLRNLLRHGPTAARLRLLPALSAPTPLPDRLTAIVERALERAVANRSERGVPTVIHVWGHSWEIEEHGLWPALESFLRAAAGIVPPAARVANGAVAEQLGAELGAGSAPAGGPP